MQDKDGVIVNDGDCPKCEEALKLDSLEHYSSEV